MGRQGSKGTWSRKEDEILFDYVSLYGEGQWEKVAQRTGTCLNQSSLAIYF